MPLILRSIEPINIARGAIPADISSELECCTSRTLAHIILQLSSLAKQSEDLFADLHYQCCCSFLRSSNLGKRIDMIKIKIIQLNPIAEEVSLQEINLRKPFKSDDLKDQQVVSRESRPSAIIEVYNKADAAPALHKLNIYREDGRDSIKFYTDPNYFVELWCFEVTKDAENQVKRQKQKIKQSLPEKIRTIRQPKSQYGSFDKHNVHPQSKTSKIDKSHITLPQAITSSTNPNAMLFHNGPTVKQHNISQHETMQRLNFNNIGNTDTYKNIHSSESMKLKLRPNDIQDGVQTLPRMFAHGSHTSAQNVNNNINNCHEIYLKNDIIKHENSDKIIENVIQISSNRQQDYTFSDDKSKLDEKQSSYYNELKNPIIPISSSISPNCQYEVSFSSDYEGLELPLPPPPSFGVPEGNNIFEDLVPSPPTVHSISKTHSFIRSSNDFPSPPTHAKKKKVPTATLR